MKGAPLVPGYPSHIACWMNRDKQLKEHSLMWTIYLQDAALHQLEIWRAYLNRGWAEGKKLISGSLSVSIHVDQNVDSILVNTISCLAIARNLEDEKCISFTTNGWRHYNTVDITCPLQMYFFKINTNLVNVQHWWNSLLPVRGLWNDEPLLLLSLWSWCYHQGWVHSRTPWRRKQI